MPVLIGRSVRGPVLQDVALVVHVVAVDLTPLAAGLEAVTTTVGVTEDLVRR